MFRRIWNVLSNPHHRLIVGSSCLLAVVIFALCAIECFKSYTSEVADAETDAKNMSQVLEKHVEMIFSKMDMISKDVMDSYDFQKAADRRSEKQALDFLSKRVLKDTQGVSFYVFDQKGNSVFRDPKDKKFNIADQPYFQEHLRSPSRDKVLIAPIRGKEANEWLILLTRRFDLADGSFGGIVLSRVRVSTLNDFFEKIRIGPRGMITLVKTDSTLVARFPLVDFLEGTKVRPPGVEFHVPDFDEVSVTHKASHIDKDTRVSATRRIANTDLMVSVGVADKDFLGQWVFSTIFSVGILIVIVLTFSIFLYRHLASLEMLETQRRKSIQSAKMSSLGEMASGISHEINNPLTIIQAQAYQIKRAMSKGIYDPQMIIDQANKIEDTVQRAAKIIKGLRSFARDSEKDPFAMVSLNSAVQNCLEFCRGRFAYHHIELRIQPIPKVSIECREAQIGQVLLNLLNNSFDAVSDLSQKWIQIDVQDLGKSVEISVIDSGLGISSAIADRIMQPFFTTKEVGKGTGLGLSISRGIVEEHGGEIFLDSTSAHTKFVVRLQKKIVLATPRAA